MEDKFYGCVCYTIKLSQVYVDVKGCDIQDSAALTFIWSCDWVHSFKNNSPVRFLLGAELSSVEIEAILLLSDIGTLFSML